MKEQSQRPKRFIFAIFIFLFGISLGYFLAKKETKNSAVSQNFTLINKEVPAGRKVDFSLFWEVWGRLERNFLNKNKLDQQKMLWGAIKGMTQSLGDPYTVFLPPEENQDSKDSLNGTFEGIGAQLGDREGRVIVVAPLKGMPAEKVGVKAGDWILKIDNEETTGWSVPEAVQKIRGPKGSQVKLTVLHQSSDLSYDLSQKPLEITIVRDTIQVPSVEFEGRDGIAILKLSRFGDTTNDEWLKAVAAAKKYLDESNGKDGLILDLRNNPGGYLQGSVYIASEFLENSVIVTQENADGSRQDFRVVRKGQLLDVPMAVLINKGSASASEIVAGALTVSHRAKLIGEKSFGKGSIQEAQDLPGGFGLHITTAKWLLPDGTWINEVGLKPDIAVEDDIKTEKIDEQLETAVKFLSTASN